MTNTLNTLEASIIKIESTSNLLRVAEQEAIDALGEIRESGCGVSPEIEEAFYQATHETGSVLPLPPNNPLN